ncbi:MAG: hypothetical protein J0H49_24595 [Acidobacteria bacterium]|nr:hypothetical protein [Acidobacteriota bacterium]
MSANLTIELPKETPAAEVDALQTELKLLADVRGAGVYEPKGLGPVELIMWVKLAAVAAPMIMQLIDTLRKRRIEKAVVTLPNGSKIEIDKATAEEIERLMRATPATTAAKA